jgi:hypothetical protein
MKKCLTVIFISILTACEQPNKLPDPPAGVMPMDSVALVLRDIHELESTLMVSAIRQDSAQNLYRALEPELFRKYQLDTSHFNRSLRFYSSDPFLLDSLYHVVLRKTDSTAVFKP